MEYILGSIYLIFFTDDFDIKVPKPSRSVKNMTIMCEETEILDVRRTPLAVAALNIEFPS